MKGQIARKAIGALKDAAPTLFTVVACAGVVAGVVLAIKATKKAEQVLPEEIKLEKNTKKRIIETVKCVGKYYIPTTVVAVGTIVCIIASHTITSKQLAAATAAYIYVAKNRDALERKIYEYTGKDVDAKKILNDIKSEINKEHIKEVYRVKAGPSVEETGRGDLLVFDSYSGRWFRSSEESVRRGCSDYIKMYEDGYTLSMNEFYILQGIHETHFGRQFGFPSSEDIGYECLEITCTIVNDFGEVNGEMCDEPVLVIDWDTYPVEGWEEC